MFHVVQRSALHNSVSGSKSLIHLVGKRKETNDSDSEEYYDDELSTLLSSVNLDEILPACTCNCHAQELSGIRNATQRVLESERATPKFKAGASAAGEQIPAKTTHPVGSLTGGRSSRMPSSGTPSSPTSVSVTYSFTTSPGTSSSRIPSSSTSVTASRSDGLYLPIPGPLISKKWFVVYFGRRMGIFPNW